MTLEFDNPIYTLNQDDRHDSTEKPLPSGSKQVW